MELWSNWETLLRCTKSYLPVLFTMLSLSTRAGSDRSRLPGRRRVGTGNPPWRCLSRSSRAAESPFLARRLTAPHQLLAGSSWEEAAVTQPSKFRHHSRISSCHLGALLLSTSGAPRISGRLVEPKTEAAAGAVEEIGMEWMVQFVLFGGPPIRRPRRW